MRLPFYLVPGDLVLLAPILRLVAPATLPRVAIAAIQGGVLPVERSFRTPIGVLQVVAGREADFTFFGLLSPAIEVRAVDRAGDAGGLVATRSVRARFPMVEWTPLRSFTTNATFAVPLQLGLGFEAPLSSRVLFPAGVDDEGGGVAWNAFVRVQLEVQHFLGAREDLR